MLYHCLLLSLTLCQAVHDRPVVVLGSIETSAVAYDYFETRKNVISGDVELDPMLRPFVHNSAMIAAEGAAEILTVTYFSEKMKHSNHGLLRKTWWIPQVVAIGAHLGCRLSSKHTAK